MQVKVTPLLAVLGLFANLACSSTTAPADDAGASTDATATPAADAQPVVVPEAGAAAPAAPTIKQLMKMAGALHVVWTNAQKDCDAIEGERKSGADDYKVIFTVPGSADNKMDGAATAKTPYTYRLRCKRGEVYSAYSNEMTETP